MPPHASSFTHSASPVRPLLKWAGGKRQLLPVLRTYYSGHFTRYVEAFLGSGAVFFDLFNAGLLDGRRVRLTDVNPDLIGTYRAVRDRAGEVIAALRALERGHRSGGGDFYYRVRDGEFNPRRQRLLAGGPAAAAEGYDPELAAMLVYLNRTGFNGLFRLNRGGLFNVPAGRYRDPRICDAEHILGVSRALQQSAAAIDLCSFEAVLAEVGAGDFVYCDPPYAPLSATSNFASYTAAGFGVEDQERLQRAIVAASGRGARVVVSNSSAPEILAAYRSAAAIRAGLVVHRVPARRAINSRASARGPVDELIITNVRPKLRMAKIDRLHAGREDQRAAARTGKRQPEVGDERHVASRTSLRARRAHAAVAQLD